MQKALKLAVVVACLALCSSAGAQQAPRQHGRFARAVIKTARVASNHITLDIAAGASSGLQAGGTQWCRSHNPNVEGCTEHYGSGTGFSIADGIFTGGMIALSEYGRRGHFKEWFLPVLGATAFNTIWGVREFRTHVPAEGGKRFHCRPDFDLTGVHEGHCRF
jgi:hypothetical protein